MSFVSKLNNPQGGQAFQTKGAKIMDVAAALRPYLNEWLSGCKNAEGMHMQPSQIQAIAINVAEEIVKQAA